MTPKMAEFFKDVKNQETIPGYLLDEYAVLLENHKDQDFKNKCITKFGTAEEARGRAV
jgi:hypothetical protein